MIKIGKLIYLLLLFIYLYSPNFKFIPVRSGVVVMCIAIVIILLHLKNIKKHICIREVSKTIAFIILLICISMFTSLINGNYEVFYIKSFMIMLLECLIGAIFFNMFFYKEKNFEQLLSSIIYVTFIQSVIVIVMLINEPIRNIVFDMTISDGPRLFSQMELRGLGLSLELLYSFSFIQSIGLICISMILKNEVSKMKIFLFALMYISIFISVMIIARTGLIGAVISIILLLPNLFKWKYFKNILFLCLGFCIVFKLFNEYMSNTLDFEKISEFAFEAINNLIKGDGLSTESTNVLLKMYKNFEVSFKTFIIGDGLYFNPHNKQLYYGNTDVGYMRNILYFGIIGTSVFYGWIINMWKKTIKESKKDYKIALIFLCIYGFIVNLKGDIYMSLMVIKMIMLFYVFYITKKENKFVQC